MMLLWISISKLYFWREIKWMLGIFQLQRSCEKRVKNLGKTHTSLIMAGRSLRGNKVYTEDQYETRNHWFSWEVQAWSDYHIHLWSCYGVWFPRLSTVHGQLWLQIEGQIHFVNKSYLRHIEDYRISSWPHPHFNTPLPLPASNLQSLSLWCLSLESLTIWASAYRASACLYYHNISLYESLGIEFFEALFLVIQLTLRLYLDSIRIIKIIIIVKWGLEENTRKVWCSGSRGNFSNLHQFLYIKFLSRTSKTY